MHRQVMVYPASCMQFLCVWLLVGMCYFTAKVLKIVVTSKNPATYNGVLTCIVAKLNTCYSIQ